MSVLLRMPESLKLALERRADREKRTRHAEILVMLEWALDHMPEQLRADQQPRP